MKRILLLVAGCLCLACGAAGVVVPVLPTTPFLLLATFLFAKSSPRLHAWIVSTKLYRVYVAPFKAAGGMPMGTKVRALAITYVVMGISAYLVQRPFVWLILAVCALIMAYVILVRIPTVGRGVIAQARSLEEERA